MPIYEYLCRPAPPEEVHKFELRQSIEDLGTATCPRHEILSTEKLISMPAPQSGGERMSLRNARHELFGTEDAPTLSDIKNLTGETLEKIRGLRDQVGQLKKEVMKNE